MRLDGFTLTWGIIVAFFAGWLIGIKRKTGNWGF